MWGHGRGVNTSFSTLSHEIMHQWGAYVFPTSPDFDHQPPAHWGATNFYGGLGGLPPDRLTHMGGLRYAYRGWIRRGDREPAQYAPLEMYLAGFFAPEDVPAFWTAPDAELVRTEDGDIYETPEREWLFDAFGKKTYSIEDIVSAYGPRIPDSSEAQWHFRGAAIVLGDDEIPVTDEHLQVASDFLAEYSAQVIDDEANVFPNYRVGFYQMTGGRGSITFDDLSQFRKVTPATPSGLPASFGTPPPVQFCILPEHGHRFLDPRHYRSPIR